MLIDITPLTGSQNRVLIDQEYEFSRDEIENTDLLALSPVHIEGSITNRYEAGYELSCTVTGTMTLPCAVTLQPVEYPFSILIEGDCEELQREIDENYKKMENAIDILPIIWENILMEIPLRVVSEDAKDAKLEGEGWKLVTGERDPQASTNPELEKLKDLL